MKRLLWRPTWILPLIACCGFLSAMCPTDFIRWALAGKPIVEITVNGEPKVQFGLRQDGVVVWRQITNTTNSPAEKPFQYDQQLWLTNGTLTNIVIIDDLIIRTK